MEMPEQHRVCLDLWAHLQDFDYVVLKPVLGKGASLQHMWDTWHIGGHLGTHEFGQWSMGCEPVSETGFRRFSGLAAAKPQNNRETSFGNWFPQVFWPGSGKAPKQQGNQFRKLVSAGFLAWSRSWCT